ncbi:MAG: MFS transporter [Wolbachia endosymbiont of Tyrophagus putrescentiae]|nr:MFS transporter [Wolbachia endosymbiont of Tyrophagus putrescentiae]
MNDIKKAILSSIICNMIVWYELTLFGVLTCIISSTFFPSEGNIAQYLITFALGFGSRPLGALIFGHIGDKYGRRKVLIASVMLVSVSSTAIGIIPSFREIGIAAPILLLICRITQGAAAGGEIGVNSAFLIEHSSDKANIGFLGSIKTFSGALGSIMCFVMIEICKKLTGEGFEIWGWRLLFHFCFFMGVIGVLTRYMISESLAYRTHKESKNLSNSPLSELFKSYKKLFIISIIVGIAQNAVVYSIVMFYNISVKEFNILGVDIKNIVRIISDMIFGICAVLFAILSDKVGRKSIMITTLVVLVSLSLPVFLLLSSDNQYIVIFTFLLTSIPIGASFGISNSLICELFPTKIRCTGSSLAHNISAGIFGGISPYVCMQLIEKTGTKLSAGIYLSICALISLIATLQIKARDKKIDW